jgi:hypothetical protein
VADVRSLEEVRMANEMLTMSPRGFQQLKGDEGAVDGLYDDPSHLCTSGVGHFVHVAEKWPSFLIAAARVIPLGESA